MNNGLENAERSPRAMGDIRAFYKSHHHFLLSIDVLLAGAEICMRLVLSTMREILYLVVVWKNGAVMEGQVVVWRSIVVSSKVIHAKRAKECRRAREIE